MTNSDNELKTVINGSFVYEQVYFMDLKPNSCFYLACPILDKGKFNVMPCWTGSHPQAPDAIVWTVINKFEFDRGYNPWVIRPAASGIHSAVKNLINSRNSDSF